MNNDEAIIDKVMKNWFPNNYIKNGSWNSTGDAMSDAIQLARADERELKKRQVDELCEYIEEFSTVGQAAVYEAKIREIFNEKALEAST